MKRFLIGCLAALAALAAKAEEPFAAFVETVSGESASVRLEARTNATVAAWVVTGTVPSISPLGVAGPAWDTTKVANGWHEVKADGGGAVATQFPHTNRLQPGFSLILAHSEFLVAIPSSGASRDTQKPVALPTAFAVK